MSPGWAGCATGREELGPGSEPGFGAGREHGGEGERGAPQALSAAQGAQTLEGQAQYCPLASPSFQKEDEPCSRRSTGQRGRRTARPGLAAALCHLEMLAAVLGSAGGFQ